MLDTIKKVTMTFCTCYFLSLALRNKLILLNIFHIRKDRYSFMKCYIRELVVGISSAEVVPIVLVTSLPWEHAQLVQLLLLEIHS